MFARRFDVDAIAEITSYADYASFSERLRKLDFDEDHSEGAPVCRWLNGQTKLDVMPLDETILGFSNRWYRSAMESAETHEVEKGLWIRVVTAVYFCGTKIEAFRGRGEGDYFASRDLEDLITVVDGRAELVDELRLAPDDLRSYVSEAITEVLGTAQFLDALPGHLLPDEASQSRIGVLSTRLLEISKLK